MAGKLGLKPFVHSLKMTRRFMVTARALDTLGPAPTNSPGYSSLVDKAVGGDWGMDGNDSVGDCTCADPAHRLMIWTAQAQPAIVIPTTAETLALYSAITGYDPSDPSTDVGSDLPTVAQYLDATGFTVGGQTYKEDGYGAIDPTNFDHIRWAITLFGCAPYGLNLPQSALDQFDAGQPWDVGGDGTIVGGHDVLGVEYQATEPCYTVVTWGKRWPVTTAFMQAYLSEVVPVVSHEFIAQSGQAPSGINLDQMILDLRSIN